MPRPQLAVWATLTLLLVLMLAGCGGPGPELHAEPSAVRVGPRSTRTEVRLVNPSPRAIQVSRLRVEGADWLGFQLEGDLPEALPAHGEASVEFRVSPSNFRTDRPAPDGTINYAEFRRGQARLAFDADGRPMVVPLIFEPERARLPRLWAAVITLLALAALHRLGARVGHEPSSARVGGLDERGGRWAMTTATAAALLVLATIPVGAGYCSSQLSVWVSDAAVTQCRNGHDGGPLTLIDLADMGLIWPLLLLMAVGLREGLREDGPSPERVVAVAALAVSVAAAALRLGEGAPTALVLAQSESWTLGTLAVPQWGIFVHPVGGTVALLALARAGDDPPLRTALAGVWVTVFAGGWLVPATPPLAHAGAVALGVTTLWLKVLIVTTLSGLLRRFDIHRSVTAAALLVLAAAQLIHVIVTSPVA